MFNSIIGFLAFSIIISLFVFSDVLHTVRMSNGHYFREIELRQRKKDIKQRERLERLQRIAARKLAKKRFKSFNFDNVSTIRKT